MTYFFKDRQWKKFQKRFPISDNEKSRRLNFRNRNRLKQILFVIIFLICVELVYIFGFKPGDLSIAKLIFSKDINLILTIISTIGTVVSAYFAIFPPRTIDKKISLELKNYRHRLPDHFVNVDCQDINPADDAERNPVRQSLREKVWEWLFDPNLERKSYLLLLGDFGTGKTTFCFYIAQEIVKTMLTLRVTIIELGQEDLDLESKLSNIKLPERENTILILDAYDEYRKRGTGENEFTKLKELTQNFLKVIITSRTNYFACREAEPLLTTRYVSYFNENQVQTFFKAYYQFRWKKYWRILKRHQQFTDLSRRVVLLNYLNINILNAIDQKEKNGLRINNYQIYSQIVYNLLPDDRNPNRLLPKSRALELMSLLGFHIICCNGANQIHYASISDHLSELLKDFSLEKSEMASYLEKEKMQDELNLISEIRTRTFFVRDNPGNYRFAHRSFAEFFAANFIKDILLMKKIKTDKIKFSITSAVFNFLEEAGVAKVSLLKCISPVFRTHSRTLTEIQVQEILQKYNFSDKRYHQKGTGFKHHYIKETLEGEEVVLDFASGLMWQQGGSPNYMIRKDAEEYVRERNRGKFAGFDDWRLPTLEEAMSLMEPKENESGLYIDPLFDITQRWIWSSDAVQGASRWWVVGFYSGGCSEGINISYDVYVRLVRSGHSLSGR